MKEMGWVIGTFKHMGEIWETRGKSVGNKKPGHRAYAAREKDRWNRWGEMAKTEFVKVLGKETFLM
jgi:hypothetical protein